MIREIYNIFATTVITIGRWISSQRSLFARLWELFHARNCIGNKFKEKKKVFKFDEIDEKLIAKYYEQFEGFQRISNYGYIKKCGNLIYFKNDLQGRLATSSKE